MRNKKLIITTIVLLLVVGFAAVSTTLYLNGFVKIASNDDFNVIFTSAKVDGVDRFYFIDKETKQTINYETRKLTMLDEESILDYEVTNKSRTYDADVSIDCDFPNSEYVDFDYLPKSLTVKSGETIGGMIKVRLKRVSTIEQDLSVTCRLTASAKERTESGPEYVEPFSKSGVMMPLYKSENFWEETPTSVLEYRENITKVVFENEIISKSNSLEFDLSETQDGSVMGYLVPNDDVLVAAKDASYYTLYDELYNDLIEEWASPLVSDKGGNQAYTLYISSDTGVKASAYSFATFYHFINLKEIQGMEYYDTSDTFSNAFTFAFCENLTSLNMSHYDVSNSLYFFGMFAGCISLTELDLRYFNTSKAIDITGMFAFCESLLNLDISSFDTSNVTEMMGTFAYLYSIETIDLSNFNTSNVTNLSGLFYMDRSLKEVDLSSFDTKNVVDMSWLFDGCVSLKSLELQNFNTDKVEIMDDIFAQCSNLLYLDIRNFDFSHLIDVTTLLWGLSNNIEIIVKDKEAQDFILALNEAKEIGWTTANVVIVS